MQWVYCVFFALTVPQVSGSTAGGAVTKVVKLLTDLEAKLEKEEEQEKELYDKFVCFSTATVSSKSKAIDEAEARVNYLETYVADIKAGKITFTMSEKQYSGELDVLNGTIKNTTAAFNTTHEKFVEKKEQEVQAIDGLQEAIATIVAVSKHNSHPVTGTPKSPSKTGLVQFRGTLQSASRLGATARMQRAQRLQKTLELGDQYLSKANAWFLRRMLAGNAADNQVSASTDKSSGAEATHAEKRVDDVIKVLVGITTSFQKDVKEITATDLKEFRTYVKRHNLQDEQLDAVKASLSRLEAEQAARAQAKQQSEEEISSLRTKIGTDSAIKDDATTALQQKEKEWDVRLAKRQGELKGIGDAIQLLTDDDARDLFSVSASFIQLTSVGSLMSAARAAGQVLLAAGKASKDQRLLILRAQVLSQLHAEAKTTNPTFDIVYKQIDAMAASINSEEESDLTKKETCEESLANNTADKKRVEREIGDEESTISLAQGNIAEIASSQKNLAAQADEIDSQIKSADEIRAASADEFAKSKKEDIDAIFLIEQATKSITDATKPAAKTGQSLLQTKTKLKQAPEPWSDGYAGAGAQLTGIVQTMKMVADGIRKDIAVAEKDEAEAKASYKTTKSHLEEEKAEVASEQSKMKGLKSTKTDDLSEASGSKTTLTNELNSLVGVMAGVKPNCDFYIKNFEKRSKTRQAELDGLKQAKVILQGS